jgi:hypothetical protein
MELLDLIGKTIFSAGEARLLVHADPSRPDAGIYAAHITFIRMDSNGLFFDRIPCKPLLQQLTTVQQIVFRINIQLLRQVKT